MLYNNNMSTSTSTSNSTISVSDIPEDSIPIIYQVPDVPDIFKTKPNIVYSSDLPYPKFSLGFSHFYHQSKDKMKITEKLNKKNIYLVLNKYEQFIDDYDKSIGSITDMYFGITKDTPKILSRAILKLWEILMLFDLIDINKPDFVSAHLAEGPGSFVQGTIYYRDLFSKHSKKDKYYCVTLHSENEAVPALAAKFINYYSKEKPVRFVSQETYTEKTASNSPDKTNGDITNPKTITIFSKNFKNKKADLVTADGGFPFTNENMQEQEAFKLIFGEIVAALNIQEKKGHFVCKIYETFVDNTLKYICILKSFYKSVYITKPLTSRPSNSEKYIVCTDYVENSKNLDVLNKMLKEIHDNKSKTNEVFNIFPDYNISNSLNTSIISLNLLVSNIQFVAINKIIDFLNKENYRGTVYQNGRDQQIVGSKFWTEMFYPEIKDSKDFITYKKKMEDFTRSILKQNSLDIKDVEKHLK